MEEKKESQLLHTAFSFLFLSLLGWNLVSLPQSLGTVAGRGSQAIWCRSSVMDGRLQSGSLTTKTTFFFNQTKWLHLLDHPSFFYFKSSLPPPILLGSLFSTRALSCILPYQSLLQWLACSSCSRGPLSAIKDASLQRLMFSYALLEHLKDSDTNTFLSRPFAPCNGLLLRLPGTFYFAR